MHDLDKLSEKVIGCAIEVHRVLGPGVLESIYEKALSLELSLQNIKHECQKIIPVVYKGKKIGEHRIDILVEDTIILELKAADKISPLFQAQLLSYLRLSHKKLGLL